MPTLIIFLPVELPQASSQVEFLVTPDGRALGTHSSAALALLPAATGDVVAVVPAQALSWHQTQLPRGLLRSGFGADQANPRLRAVLEGLLEEHLLDEPAQLHFALSPHAQEGAPVWVAACDRAWLRAWVQALEHQQRPAARIVPEFAPELTPRSLTSVLPAVQVMGTLAQPSLAFSNLQGAVVAMPLTPATVSLANLNLTIPGQGVQAAAQILAEPAVAELAEHHFQRPARLQSRPERWLVSNQSAWDLAQFDLVSSGRLRSWRRLRALIGSGLRSPDWRAARWAAIALVVANLVGLNAWAWAQRASLDAKRQAVREVLTGTFPGVKTVIDAPVQMEREMQRLRAAAGEASGGDFELLLSAYGNLALAGASLSARNATALEFTLGELRVKGLKLGRVDLDQLAIQARPLAVVLRLEADSLVLSPAGNGAASP